jgi:hypothetical protein
VAAGCAGNEVLRPALENMLQEWMVSKRVNNLRRSTGLTATRR